MSKGKDKSPSVSQASVGMFGHSREISRLRLLFLLPLIIAIITALTLAIYQYEHQLVQHRILHIRASAQNFYDYSIRNNAGALQAIMVTLQRNRDLQAALANSHRQALLIRTSTLLDELKKHYDITHLYFSDTDRVNLLRVHAANLYGDRIDRITTLTAEKNGTSSFGVETGPLGTFTLRLVTPWYAEKTQQLIGYVELGMEIDRVLQNLRDFFEIEVLVLIHKDHLDRETWENGMRTLGRTPDWERFPTMVQEDDSRFIPPQLAERLARGELSNTDTIIKTINGDASYWIAFLPLQDAGGRSVAHMLLIADVSQETNAVLRTVYAGSLTALVIGILLFVFFNWQVGRIGRRIESNAQVLEQLATHDGLTGLYNHRTFYTLLEAEITRARRFKHSCTLLLIDIDHFKRVNDTYGHQAGDTVLRDLSKLLVNQVRVVDRVCRYGGEEITVILPDTNIAPEMAERLRTIIAATPFDIGVGKTINITASIGLASFPSNGDSVQILVSAADAALYAAKDSGRNKVCMTTYKPYGKSG